MIPSNGERPSIPISSFHGSMPSTTSAQQCYRSSKMALKGGMDTGGLQFVLGRMAVLTSQIYGRIALAFQNLTPKQVCQAFSRAIERPCLLCLRGLCVDYLQTLAGSTVGSRNRPPPCGQHCNFFKSKARHNCDPYLIARHSRVYIDGQPLLPGSGVTTNRAPGGEEKKRIAFSVAVLKRGCNDIERCAPLK